MKCLGVSGAPACPCALTAVSDELLELGTGEFDETDGEEETNNLATIGGGGLRHLVGRKVHRGGTRARG